MKRRNFIQGAAATSLGLSTSILPFAARAAGPDFDVIVVGGGMAGAAAAKYVRLWSQGQLSVALIEKDAAYTSNIMSNEVLTGKRSSVSSLSYSYSNLQTKYGISRIQGTVTRIDAGNKTIACLLPNGSTVTKTYDRLVMAPGLEFDLMPGMTNLKDYDTLVPHAWKAGAQTTLLRKQLVNMPNGGPVVITIPLAPYRCPPGPYERACVIADWLRIYKPGSKVIVLDANNTIQAQAVNFQNAFNGLYGYTVDYRSGCTVTNVNAASKTVTYTRTVNNVSTTSTITAGVLNPIPPQRAPGLLKDTGLLSGAFAPVNLLTYESTLLSGIHVIGDASVSGMPKAGHIGNQEAKTCANAIVAARLPSYALSESSPVLNSACFTPVTSSKATWLSAVYQYDPEKKMMMSATNNGYTQPRAATSASSDNYQDMEKWFATLMGDTFA